MVGDQVDADGVHRLMHLPSRLGCALQRFRFQDVLGTSPLKYGTALRLARVRRELKWRNTTVAHAASRSGF